MVLGTADVYTTDTAFWVMESLRLDVGLASQVHSEPRYAMTSTPRRHPSGGHLVTPQCVA